MQRGQLFTYARLASLLGWSLLTAGCACSCPRCAPTTCPGWQPSYSVPHACFGHYSTCWRAFPTECTPCPSFAARRVPGVELVPTAEAPPVMPQPPATVEPPAMPTLPIPELHRAPLVPPPNDMGTLLQLSVPPSVTAELRPASHSRRPLTPAPLENHQ
jgi:hypothetical protein